MTAAAARAVRCVSGETGSEVWFGGNGLIDETIELVEQKRNKSFIPGLSGDMGFTNNWLRLGVTVRGRSTGSHDLSDEALILCRDLMGNNLPVLGKCIMNVWDNFKRIFFLEKYETQWINLAINRYVLLSVRVNNDDDGEMMISRNKTFEIILSIWNAIMIPIIQYT